MPKDIHAPAGEPSIESHNAGFFVPGTCFATAEQSAIFEQTDTATIDTGTRRDEGMRQLYATHALAAVGRLLGAVDRNPYHKTYGCLDRQFWHYRTADFPSEMYQEGALPLALAFTDDVPGNRWFQSQRVRELAVAAIDFAVKSSHADCSCDDYYPFERALGAAVFSLAAATRAYQLLGLDDVRTVEWFCRRANWIVSHDESGRLANHHALAALGLLRVGEISGRDKYIRAAEERIATVLDWQHAEGWFDEYGGADPGYQTVTIDSLAKIRRVTRNAGLDEPLRRAVAFAREFLHPDNSYAGEYGSRGTYHFYPHGMELLVADHPAAAADAADLADGFLAALAAGKAARFDDDRLFAHQAGNFFEAYHDWSPQGPPNTNASQNNTGGEKRSTYFSGAQILVRREERRQTVVSAARGGVFKHFWPSGDSTTDAGLIVETTDGRIAVSQSHNLDRTVEHHPEGGANGDVETLNVSGPLYWARHETADPLRQAAFHVGMTFVGRFCRGLVRRVLQRRLITGRKTSGIVLTRRFEFHRAKDSAHGYAPHVIDTIELTDPTLHVARMSLGSDHQSAYVAASGVYQESVLTPWIDLSQQVEQLNRHRTVVIRRDLSAC